MWSTRWPSNVDGRTSPFACTYAGHGAPDGTSFSYLNPLRCPHCTAPYIDFESRPEIRAGEYYGNYLHGTDPQRYNDAFDFMTALEPVRSLLIGQGFREEPVRSEGYLSRISFRREEAQVDLAYGPPEYHVEMFMRREGRQRAMYELADLMTFPELDSWVRANGSPATDVSLVVAECRFFARLLELALPLIFGPEQP